MMIQAKHLKYICSYLSKPYGTTMFFHKEREDPKIPAEHTRLEIEDIVYILEGDNYINWLKIELVATRANVFRICTPHNDKTLVTAWGVL